MSSFALVRPDAWNLPLLVHVLGAMVLVGGLVSAAAFLASARRNEQLLRFGYWSLLAVAVPGWVVMRVGAAWIASREGWDDVPSDAQPTWLSIGAITADVGGVLLAVTVVVGGAGLYRLRQDKGTGALRAALVLSVVLLAAYVVAAWSMAGKPD